MGKNSFTIKHSITVKKPLETVWGFTQNYENRPRWDDAVLETAPLPNEPNRTVKLKMRGGTTMTLVYKLDDRPRKTTLVAREIESPIIESAGGSWSYESSGEGTLWSQTNTIGLKSGIFATLFRPFLKWIFAYQMKQAMAKAKKLMEREV